MEFECTEKEFRVFESLVEEGFKGSFPYFLELVLLGLKPATVPTAYEEIEFTENQILEMGLEIRVVELDFVDTEDLPDYAKKPGKMFFVGRKEDLKDLKNSYEERKEYRKDFGIVMGYPREDVEWFVRREEVAYEKARSEIKNLEELLAFVGYVPKPEKERIENARNAMEEYKKAIREADRRFGSTVGGELLGCLRENQ
ncbi:MAG: hypothetical protein H8Z69_00275 [Nanohaloarchaea archaeon]|nr:hypothetical protein [Candidatus Nanohaloarchaea archaeon]